MSNKLRAKYLQWLLPYISEDDDKLDRETFLRYLADRIHDDLSHKPNPPGEHT